MKTPLKTLPDIEVPTIEIPKEIEELPRIITPESSAGFLE